MKEIKAGDKVKLRDPKTVYSAGTCTVVDVDGRDVLIEFDNTGEQVTVKRLRLERAE